MKQNRILSIVFSVTGIIIVSKLLGFGKQVLTASIFGATIETDLLSLSEGLIGNFKYVLVQVLLTALVSTYVAAKEQNALSAGSYATNVLFAGSLALLPFVLIIILASPWLARLIAPSYDAALSARLAAYLRRFAPVLLLFGWMAVFHALLNANKRFIPGQMEGLNQSVIQIALLLLLAKSIGVRALVLSFFIGAFCNTVFLGVLSRRYFSKPVTRLFRDPSMLILARMIIPLLLGYSLVYVNQQVDMILVSGLAPGTVTAVGYAAVLYNLIGTMVVAVGSILFPYMAERISRGEQKRAAELGVSSALILLIGILPVSILTVLCAEDIVVIVYERGAFSHSDVLITASALVGYVIGGFGLVLREVFSRFQYGYQDAKKPMINSLIGIVCNIALSVALCPVWGAFGVAFASSVSVIICGFLNAYTAKKKNEYLYYAPILKKLPLLLLGCTVCISIAVAGKAMLSQWPPLWRFLLITVLSMAGYFAVTGVLLRKQWNNITI